MNRGYTITIIIVIIFQNTATATYLTLPTTNGEENNIYTDSAYITTWFTKKEYTVQCSKYSRSKAENSTAAFPGKYPVKFQCLKPDWKLCYIATLHSFFIRIHIRMIGIETDLIWFSNVFWERLDLKYWPQ